ncbi:ABC transporter permease [Streptomyces sp. NBC_00257]|uniref:ABC transporter permease n=1 Tax=unclassified Streptomyces TaxID=2593676 RepID=UPI0022570283|nr:MULTISPECIES: ABC transporter permease [unclassified Streptomyces]MCX5433483.1 ABC transporter permease [Streptomyces sp. NBC_00062]WTB52518.1 ABC transporter permease [Streptomyces sp. NBC_00826]WTH94590.1 ABC transporter permease [Streptomyces sp. NBC_00825]WTI03325.1 ABC transporter permease [Streptomyces sp. NBC_00822]
MNGTRASVRLSISSLRAHKRRFAGTFVAVLLGVAFLTGTLVMGDTLRASFDTMFTDANAGTDAVVRGADMITVAGETRGTRQPVSTALVKRIERTPGVAAAAPDIQGAGQLSGADGKPIGGQGPPTLAGNWIDDPELNPYRLAAGRAPAAPGEVVVNRGTADRGGLRIGDTTVLRTPDPVHVRIVGLATFGGQDGMGQVTYTAMTQADAEKYLTPKPGEASAIQVRAGPGTGQRELVDALRPVLPKGVEAITGQAAAAENRDMISGAFLGMFTTLLLVFSGIVLLVATFSIHNTFAIVVAQRTRENALLRALGAARRQVVVATLVEATAVAVIASAAGLAGGIGIAAGLQALFPAVGFPFPDGSLVIGAVSLLLPLAVGVLVCLGSALLPAVRAGRTAPLAALRESAVDDSGASRTRAVTGLVLLAASVGAVLGGTLAPSLWLSAVGAVAALAAFVILGPVAATYAVRTLGAPLGRLRGVTGGLARRNALRSPRRTASTATALMIGVAVVSLFTVFGASLKATMNRTVDRSFAGDVAISAPAFGAGGSGLSPRLAPAVGRLPQVATAVGLGKGVAEVDGAGRALTVTDPAALGRVFDLGRVDGSLTGLGTNGIAVSAAEAAERGLRPGSPVRLTFTDGARQDSTVRAVYDRAELAGDYVITRRAWAPHRAQDSDSLVAVSFAPGVSTADGKAAVAKTAAAYGNPDVQTRGEYAKSSADAIDMMLTLVYALLALAVLIALLGIANTLTLALHERTRELGLLRAVGQTRSQLRSMVRWESVLVAAFGTAGGLLLGGFLGRVLIEASAGDTAVAFDLPPLRLLAVALVGIAAGALAGLRPARRAARLDVLRAIAAQ